jgi:hypothetical protein
VAYALLGKAERGQQSRAEDQGTDGQAGRPPRRLGVGEAEDDAEKPG